MTLGVICIEQAVGRYTLDDLRQLPAEVHRILQASAESLSADRRVDMCGVAGEQHASAAILRRLSRRVGETRDPGWTVHAVVSAARSDEQLLEIVQRRLGG